MPTVPPDGTTSASHSTEPSSSSSSLLDAFLDLTPDAAIVADASGVIRAANRGAATMFAYPPGSIAGLEIEMLLPDRFRSSHRRHRDAYVARPRARSMGAGLDLYGRRADGTEFPVDVSLASLTSGEEPLVVAAIRDLTERRRAQAAEARLAALVTSADIAVISTTPDRLVDSWNPGAERLLGYRATETIGRPLSSFVDPLEVSPLVDAFDRAESDPGGQRLETIVPHRDGPPIEVAVTVSAVRDLGGQLNGFAVVARDLTTERAAERERNVARTAEQELMLVADRERIARDLHDLVIQRLFAAGLSLQSVAARSDAAEVRDRLVLLIGDLDTTIREIRSTIFALERRQREAGLRARVADVVSQAADSLGFHPALRFDGPVDTVVPDHIAEHVLAVVTEALSNVARHAGARSAQVDVIAGRACTVTVTDDGRGFDEVSRMSGIKNLEQRAQALGGTFEIVSAVGAGTSLSWQIPLS